MGTGSPPTTSAATVAWVTGACGRTRPATTRTESAWTPTAPSGTPTWATSTVSGCARAVRCWRPSIWIVAPSPARSAARITRACSSSDRTMVGPSRHNLAGRSWRSRRPHPAPGDPDPARSGAAPARVRRRTGRTGCPRLIAGICASRPGPSLGSADPAGDVGLGAAVPRVVEDLLGPAVLDEDAGAGVALLVAEHGEEGGAVADPGGLLHVVRDDDDRVFRLDRVHQVLDGRRRDRVERRAGLVHEDHVRLDGERA